MSTSFRKLAVADLANQYAIPLKSLTGMLISRWSAAGSKHINNAVVERLNLHSDSKVLEIGYGRGNAIGAVLQHIKSGNGIIFGVERSPYMEHVTRQRFVLEEQEEKKLVLDRVFDLRHLSYPTDFFDAIYHVDLFYFLHQDSMFDIARELNRVLKPEGQLLCGMQFARLQRLEKLGLLTHSQCDPIRYMQCLEPAGFEHVKMEYTQTPKGEVQIISAKKQQADAGHDDPEERLRLLEKDIKREMLRQRLLQSGMAPTAEDMKELQ